MEHRRFAPDPRLAPHVRFLWTLRGSAPEAPGAERVLPDGCVELVFHLGEPFRELTPLGRSLQPRALLVGPTSAPLELEPTGAIDVIGVRLRPGAAAALVRAPLERLRDAIVPLESAETALGAATLERLHDAGSTRARLALLESLLLELVARAGVPDAPLERALAAIERTGGGIGVDALARGVGLGARQLERCFQARVGLAPKLFARLVRFRRALAGLAHAGRGRLADVAASAGYFDQAHLVRDFRRFAGTTPGAWLRERHALADLLAAERRPKGEHAR